MARVWDQPLAGVSPLIIDSGQSATAGRAVQIVDFKSNRSAVLNEREIQRIIKQEDLPTVVVSIGGVARSGKSFLLNLLVNYLSYLEKHNTASGWETSDHPVQGVNWAQSRTAVTLGLWMWSKPFVIRRQDGKRVAVLLVDSQGTGDNRRSDSKLDTLIMYISLHLSSFQLINIVNYLTSNELTCLELCTHYVDIDKDSPTRGQSTCCHLFDNLIFVVRNCQYTKVFGEEPKLFQEIKEECRNDDLRRVVLGIDKAFRHITAFAFPYPGDEIAGASEVQKIWTLQDIPKRFLDTVKELATVLFTSDRMAAEELPTGSQILEKFKILKMRLESTDLPEIGNPSDALQETILYQAYSKADILYTDTIGEVQRNLLSHKSVADLRKTLASARDLALQVFHSEGRQHKYGQSIIWSKYEELFQANCDKHQNVLIVKYDQEIEIAYLKRQLDEQARQLDEKTQQMDEQTQQLDEITQQIARKIGKLESDAKETHARLEEARKHSEKQHQENQASLVEAKRNSEAQLNKVTEKMETARTFYEKEIELQKRSTLLEELAKTRADILSLQEEWRTKEKNRKKEEKEEKEKMRILNSAMKKTGAEHKGQIKQIQEDLKNKNDKCSVM